MQQSLALLETVSGVANRSEHKDGNQLGVAAGMIWGAVKSRYNSADFGTIVMSSYAVAP